MSEARLQSLLDQGVADGIFPSAQAVVLHRGERKFEGVAGGAEPGTLFDLASLTKVMCTTAAFMALWAEGEVDPSMRLATILPRAPVARGPIDLADLLYHRSGLPAFVPFFAPVMEAFPLLFSLNCPAVVRTTARRRVVEAAMDTRPSTSGTVYSDVGFLILGEALAQTSSSELDALYRERIASVLGLSSHFRRLSSPAAESACIAPTGKTRPREPAPGQEGLWDVKARESVGGEVDDDNAWSMDGVAGHAGLFGTAADVAKFGQAVLDELQGAAKLAPPSSWQLAVTPDPKTPGSTRALGFDTPAAPDVPGGSSAGRYIGRIPPGAIGHLGFTGCSLWIDMARQLVVALCTNRTFPGRRQVRIRDFRPTFHDAVVEAVGV